MKGQPSKYTKEQRERGSDGQAMGLGSSVINPVPFGSKQTPGLNVSPLQHPEVKPLVLHLLLHAENLAHAVMPQPNPPDMEVKGLHKIGQTQFWGGSLLQGTSMPSAAARTGQKWGSEQG